VKRWRGPAIELAVAATVLLLWAGLGTVTGWKGRPKTAISTAVWPFYFDTWFPKPVFTWRALLPLVGLGAAWLPIRRWTAGGRAAWLIAIVVAAYAVHAACGVVHNGFQQGFELTFSRVQEYWNDVRFVHPGFLARFPEFEKPLSQHGATHPPGLTLVLAALVALGAKKRAAAELICSTACALTALPLYGAARRLTDERTARVATVLFLFACSVTAFAVLAMDSVTMLFATLALYGFVRALDGDFFGGVLWGVALAAATLCTLTSFTLGLTYGVLLATRFSTLRRDGKRLLALACGPVAFLASYAVLVLGFDYRPFHVFAYCWAAFAKSDDARRWYGVALIGNPVAFLGSLGLPLMGLAGRTVGGAAERLWRRRDLSTVALVAAAALPPLVCILLGKPRAEVERIYLLFVPPMALAAAVGARRWYARSDRWVADLAVPVAVVQSILVEIFFQTMW
jgi:hypothetical protein